MPPIRVYTESPIVATKASGVTPQTALSDEGDEQTRAQSQPILADTSAQTPTSTQNTPNYAPIPATPTRTQALNDGPPPPQPGAVPHLPVATATLPPPPKAGEKYQPPKPTVQLPGVTYPPQMSIPAPTAPYSQLGTATASAPSYSLPGHLPASAGVGGSLSHPPGYQQNPNASGLDRYQQDVQKSSLAYDSRDEGVSDDGVWNSARKWAQAAGEKLSAAEDEVWRRINKK
ncbi:hypothetical protein B0H67DRAFT_275599 [Lasiosphaeris hirsuta]|uniref:Uncharacterized protein n=1 Tax=Lasiosphaeris hirsuta TaxID=260670 RepID=A0AA40A899_9PEZI|nr:hypothetical protein B0H67DRAFT_275599 [Lasiosphaeris hirsuta]